MSDFQEYRRKQIAELRPWQAGDDMSRVSISVADKEAGSPKPGDMIARNPKNHDDQWLVAAAYFADNFEPKTAKFSQAALLLAAKKLRRLRIETVGGRRERAARTIGSIIDREGDLAGDDEFIAWMIKNALRYYADAEKAAS